MSFQEIILLLTFIGSCIYATVSLTIKVLAFLLQNKKRGLLHIVLDESAESPLRIRHIIEQ